MSRLSGKEIKKMIKVPFWALILDDLLYPLLFASTIRVQPKLEIKPHFDESRCGDSNYTVRLAPEVTLYDDSGRAAGETMIPEEGLDILPGWHVRGRILESFEFKVPGYAVHFHMAKLVPFLDGFEISPVCEKSTVTVQSGGNWQVRIYNRSKVERLLRPDSYIGHVHLVKQKKTR